MKKRIGFVIFITLIVFLAYWSIRYNSLERRLVLVNLNYHKDVKLAYAKVYDNNKSIKVKYKEYATTKNRYDVIKGIENNCIKSLRKMKVYDGYRVSIVFSHAAFPEYTVRYDENMETECLKLAPISAQDISSFAKILNQHLDVKEIEIDNYFLSRSEECCRINNYNDFKKLGKIKFMQKPSDEIIEYLKENIPNCEIEYN